MLTLTDGGEPGAGHRRGRSQQRQRACGALGAAGRDSPSTRGRVAAAPRARPHARRRRSRRRTDARQAAASRRRPADGDQGRRSRVAHRVAWSAPVPLWRVKRAGRAHGATVNDVLVAAVTAAVGRHLRDEGDEVDEVHALVPFNLRPLDRPLPRELGNRFGLVLLGLPVGIDDPPARLAEVKRRMDAIKDSHEGAFAYGILGLMGRTPAAARGAPDRLLHRQGLDGAHQRARPTPEAAPSPARRWPACSCGRRARAASG